MMDRVKEECVEEQGGERAVMGQSCTGANHLHLTSSSAECF